MQNKPIKTIFVCEFITGGGLNDSDLPPALAVQGQQMRDALLHDLSSLPYQIQTTIDARLVPPINGEVCRVINRHESIWQIWEEEIQKVDAVWLIAPETDGCLAKMTALALKQHKVILGCGLAAISVCSSKLKTYQLLTQVGIATLPTVTFSQWKRLPDSQWLVKPDDGAGCEQTICFDKAEDVERWALDNPQLATQIIQPYVAGDAASISCVMHQGKAHMLSCNKQLVRLEDNILSFNGCVVNGMCDYWDVFEHLANRIAALLPTLAGYVGIDVIVNDSNNELIIVEINPRLTTSYVALRAATNHNPAALVMHTLLQEGFVWPAISRNEVVLEVGHLHV